ncbi:hypothetical protein SAMN02787118_12036 [Streptomyces mirabilis]|jgi:hypothetical protein|uniref:Uncharacterized protein n=1 Tax=Streptomyces mirabilis TaxID=68239 RepID=A0A1I2RKJ7_9ACTN|nr:hypothetical protein SAMN02787118_12036 [Streptomyces mirabilis]
MHQGQVGGSFLCLALIAFRDSDQSRVSPSYPLGFRSFFFFARARPLGTDEDAAVSARLPAVLLGALISRYSLLVTRYSLFGGHGAADTEGARMLFGAPA